MSSFLEGGVEGWTSRLGRLRDVVRQRVLAHQLAGTLDPGARVLDVGCGQGTQALALARAGHDVVGLDPSVQLLARFSGALAAEPAAVRERVRLVEGVGERAPELVDGPFDALLCHGLLMYLDDPGPLLAALTAVATPSATLSLLVRNGLALAMRYGLSGDAERALASFDHRRYTNRIGIAALAHTPDDLDAVLEPLGWRRARWYGVRVLADHRDEPAPPDDDPALETLLAAEVEAGRRDPYRQVAGLLHVLYTRGGPAADRAGG